jgi:hypothetical protein
LQLVALFEAAIGGTVSAMAGDAGVFVRGEERLAVDQCLKNIGFACL